MEHAVDLSETRKGPLPGVFELPRNYRRAREGETKQEIRYSADSTDSYNVNCLYCRHIYVYSRILLVFLVITFVN